MERHSDDDDELPVANPEVKRARVASGGKRSVLAMKATKGLNMDTIGARAGEVFTGILSTNSGAIIRVSFNEDSQHGMIPPKKEAVRFLIDTPELHPRLMEIPFFAALPGGLNSALDYLSAKATLVSEEEGRFRVFERIPGLLVHFLDLGKHDGQGSASIFANENILSSEDQAWLCEKPRPYTEIGARFPALTKDLGATLISGVGQWSYRDGT